MKPKRGASRPLPELDKDLQRLCLTEDSLRYARWRIWNLHKNTMLSHAEAYEAIIAEIKNNQDWI
jgi:hypothetical protein